MGYKIAILPVLLFNAVVGVCDKMLDELNQKWRHPIPVEVPWPSRWWRARQRLGKHSKKQLIERASSVSFVLILIGLFKLFKALLLIAVGIGARSSSAQGSFGTVLHWVQVLRVDPDNRYIHGILVKIFRVTPKQLKELSVGTFLYAGCS
jgi:hypothetical protein